MNADNPDMQWQKKLLGKYFFAWCCSHLLFVIRINLYFKKSALSALIRVVPLEIGRAFPGYPRFNPAYPH